MLEFACQTKVAIKVFGLSHDKFLELDNVKLNTMGIDSTYWQANLH